METPKYLLDLDKKMNRKRLGLFGPYEYYCPECKKSVQTKRKKFNWGAFIGFTLLGGIGLLYPIYHFFLKSKTRCEYCDKKIVSSMNKGLYKK